MSNGTRSTGGTFGTGSAGRTDTSTAPADPKPDKPKRDEKDAREKFREKVVEVATDLGFGVGSSMGTPDPREGEPQKKDEKDSDR